jgi:exodeoxyribonuclease VII small subunit
MKFEEKMGQLEAIVKNMESGEMKLDDMIHAFEEGQNLAKECSAELESIRLRIEKVTSQGTVEELKLEK